jgi:hypothetical protein
MLFLVAGVQIGVVGLAGLDHLPKDFEQPLAETTQGAGMTFAFGAFLSVVNLGPGADPQTALGPEMDGMAQNLVTLVTDADAVNLAGLETDRSRSGDALQGLGVLEAIGVAADFAQQARGQRLGRAGQRAKEVMVGMLLEESFDLLAVEIQLELEGFEQPGQTNSQQALGRGHGRGAAEEAGVLEDFHSFGGRFRPPQFLGVEEFFPASLAGRGQFFRGGKLEDKGPAKRLRPVLEGLKSRRIILDQRLLELVDQGGALLDQTDLVPAQQLELLGQGVHRLKGFPVLAVQAQGLGQRPGIQTVGFVAAERFALAVAFGAERVDGVNAAVPLQELIHGGSLAGFDGDGQGGMGLHLFLELPPALQGMFDAKVSDDLTLAIHDHDIVMIASPVEAGVMSDFDPRFHNLAFGCSHRGAVGSHPDTGSLAGCCSLRHCDSRC